MIDFSGRIHLFFALMIWVLLCVIDTGYGNKLWFSPFPFLLGSIFPDADIRWSFMGKIFPLWLFFQHRKWVHSIQALVVFSTPIALWKLEWGLAFAGGYLLHLAMDSSTPSGIRWWNGQYKKRAVH